MKHRSEELLVYKFNQNKIMETKTQKQELSLSITYSGDSLEIIKKFKELVELIYKERNWRNEN